VFLFFPPNGVLSVQETADFFFFFFLFFVVPPVLARQAAGVARVGVLLLFFFFFFPFFFFFGRNTMNVPLSWRRRNTSLVVSPLPLFPPSETFFPKSISRIWCLPLFSFFSGPDDRKDRSREHRSPFFSSLEFGLGPPLSREKESRAPLPLPPPFFSSSLFSFEAARLKRSHRCEAPPFFPPSSSPFWLPARPRFEAQHEGVDLLFSFSFFFPLVLIGRSYPRLSSPFPPPAGDLCAFCEKKSCLISFLSLFFLSFVNVDARSISLPFFSFLCTPPLDFERKREFPSSVSFPSFPPLSGDRCHKEQTRPRYLPFFFFSLL